MHAKCIGEFLAHGGLPANGKQRPQRHHQYRPDDLASGEGELRTDASSSTQLRARYGGFANGIHDSTSVYVPSVILQLDHQDMGKDTAVTSAHSFIQQIRELRRARHFSGVAAPAASRTDAVCFRLGALCLVAVTQPQQTVQPTRVTAPG